MTENRKEKLLDIISFSDVYNSIAEVLKNFTKPQEIPNYDNLL